MSKDFSIRARGGPCSAGYRGRISRGQYQSMRQEEEEERQRRRQAEIEAEHQQLSSSSRGERTRCLSAPPLPEDGSLVSLICFSDEEEEEEEEKKATSPAAAAPMAPVAGNDAQRHFPVNRGGGGGGGESFSRPSPRPPPTTTSATSNNNNNQRFFTARSLGNSRGGSFHQQQQQFGNRGGSSSSPNWRRTPRNESDALNSNNNNNNSPGGGDFSKQGPPPPPPPLSHSFTAPFSRGPPYGRRFPRGRFRGGSSRGRGGIFTPFGTPQSTTSNHHNHSNFNSPASSCSSSGGRQSAFSLAPVERFKDARAPPKRWAVYCFDDFETSSSKLSTTTAVARDEQLGRFTDLMIKQARFFGMPFGRPVEVKAVLVNRLDVLEHFFAELELNALELVFLGIARSYESIPDTATVYNLIKERVDDRLGVISCCFNADYVQRPPYAYFNNFLLKVNAKLGGVNQVPVDAAEYLAETADTAHLAPRLAGTEQQQDQKQAEIMFVGVVTHQVTFTEGTHSLDASISAAVGSRDPAHFAKYTSAVRVQPPAAAVLHVDAMVRELLAEYRADNEGRLPTHLVLFRDGVRRAGFAHLRELELAHLQRMLAKVVSQHGGQQRPQPIKLSVVVVQKRFNFKSAGGGSGEEGGKVPAPENLSQNLSQRRRRPPPFPSEVVIDEEVTDDDEDVFDLSGRHFFNSKDKEQMTRFIVLPKEEDEEEEEDDGPSNFTLKQLQHLAYLACQNYARSAGGRRVADLPTSIRYAHLCAARAKLNAEAGYRQIVMTMGRQQQQLQSAESIISQLNDKVQQERAVARKLYYF